MNIAEKVVRIDADAYDFIVDFANQYDLKISESASILLRYCATKDLSIQKQEIAVIETRTIATDN